MYGLDLFSGIGGISYALKEWIKPIAYCEIDPYCQGVLLSRMGDFSIPNAPIWDDITSLRSEYFNNNIDIIYGGFPCQDISIAGNGKGLEGERSGLFFEIIRLAKEIQPQFLFLENVPAITTRGGLQVIRTIAEMGYDCRWCVISASSVGALHKRERWFLLANTNGTRRDQIEGRKSIGFKEKYPESCYASFKSDCYTYSQSSKQTDTMSESEPSKFFTWGRYSGQYWPFESREHWQEIVSKMGKCSNGIPYHVDRLRALGNSVVPAQAKKAFKMLMGI